LFKKLVPVLKKQPGQLPLFAQLAPINNPMARRMKSVDLVLKELTRSAETREGLVEFAESCTRLAVAYASNAREDEPVVIVEGALDAARIEQAMTWAGRTKPQGIELQSQHTESRKYHRLALPGDAGTWYAALLDEHHLVFSPVQGHITEALAREAGKNKTNLAQDLQALIRQIDPKWTIWYGDVTHDDLLANVRLGVTIGDGVEVEALVTPRRRDDVVLLADEVKQDLAAARASVDALAKKAEVLKPLAPLLAKVQVAPKGETVHFHLSIPPAVVDQVLERLSLGIFNDPATKGR
jgi:hypothetical protein